MIGSEGTAGCGVTVNAVAVLVHPLLFLAVTLYIPATTPVNIPVVLVYVELPDTNINNKMPKSDDEDETSQSKKIKSENE